MPSPDLPDVIAIGGTPVFRIALLGLLVVGMAWAAIIVARIGPSNIIGRIRYDHREKGKLRVGDQAPDVQLVTLDGKTTARLSEHLGGCPSVLVFGSFT